MTQPVVLRRARLATVFAWGILVPLWALIGGLLLIAVVASELDAVGRVVAGIGLVLVVAYLWWFVRHIPRQRDALVLTIDDRTITGRQGGEVTTIDRREVWFVEVRELRYRGVPYIGIHGHGGRLLARWDTGWRMAASSGTVRRRLRRAGLPWVHVYNGQVWKREGVDAEAEAFAGQL